MLLYAGGKLLRFLLRNQSKMDQNINLLLHLISYLIIFDPLIIKT